MLLSYKGSWHDWTILWKESSAREMERVGFFFYALQSFYLSILINFQELQFLFVKCFLDKKCFCFSITQQWTFHCKIETVLGWDGVWEVIFLLLSPSSNFMLTYQTDEIAREQDFTISLGSPFQQPIGSASFLFHIILRGNILFFLENKNIYAVKYENTIWIFWIVEVEISLAFQHFVLKLSSWDNPFPCSVTYRTQPTYSYFNRLLELFQT